jgi:CysZ protein
VGVFTGPPMRCLYGMFPEGWLGQVGYYASLIGLVLLAVMLAFGFWILMQGLLCGVYYEKLTRRIEEIIDSATSQFDDLPFTRGMLDAARNAGALVTTTAGLQVLHIVPVVGSIAALGLSLYFDWFILGCEYFDYPLSLRGLDRAQKQAFVKAHRGHTLGIGAAVMTLMTVPVLGTVLLTSAVAGAVLLHRRLIEIEQDD